MKSMPLPSAAAASASLIFGASIVATRFIAHEIDPLLLSFIRYAVASLCLAPVVLLLVKECPAWRDLMASAGLGILCFGLMPWFSTAGIEYIPAARAALWLATIPFLTFLLAAGLRYEPVTGAKVAGLTLATVGVVLALGPDAVVGVDPGQAWRGDLLLFAAAGCGALFTALSRPVLQRVPATLVTCCAMISGTAFLGVLSWTTGVLAVPVLTAYGWLVVIGFLGIIAGALGFFLWTWAVRQSTPTRTAVFLTLNPTTAALLGAVLLGESVTMPFLIGLALVLAGIVVSNLRAGGGRQIQIGWGARGKKRAEPIT